MAYSLEAQDIYGALTYYRELSYFISRREEYERALTYFNEALQRDPKDKRTLLGRAWARSKECHYSGALEDIARILEQEQDLIAVAQKALNMYLCCEFEKALVFNYRMVPIRKMPDNFTMGVMHCNEAIENTLGARAGHPLRDHYKVIRKLAWKQAMADDKADEPIRKQKKKKRKPRKAKKAVREPVVPAIRSKKSSKDAGAGKKEEDVFAGEALEIRDSLNTLNTESAHVPPCSFPFRPLQRRTTNLENYMAEKYLDTLCLDKMFLKGLKINPGVKCPNKSGVKRILQMGKEGFKTISYKQELLRTRRPFYFIKYQEARLSSALLGRIEAELRKMQMAASKDADALLSKIKDAIHHNQSRVALETAEKLKIYCDMKPKKVLPARESYLQEIYKLVAMAHYQMFRINKNQYELLQNKRVFAFLGMPHGKDPSTDSVINQFKDVCVDWKKMVIIYEQRLRKATSPEEMAWLYHELARFHTELKQFELARVYARKCISEAREINNIHWVINAMMLMAKINIQQNSRNDAKAGLHETKLVAEQIEDEKVVEYINRCLLLVDKVDYDDSFGAKVLEQREKQIIQMMAGAGMKGEVTYLFRKMSVMPVARRMSVMPGVRLEESEGPKQTAASRKMSIMPTAKEADEPSPQVAKMGGKKEKKEGSEGTKGIAFMELIKYHVD